MQNRSLSNEMCPENSHEICHFLPIVYQQNMPWKCPRTSHKMSNFFCKFASTRSSQTVFFMLRWQALTVAAVIPIVWLDFSKICLPHPSTTASLMFCRFAKFLPKGKTWGRTRQRPAMTDFHRKVNKFWQRFAKCDLCLKVRFVRLKLSAEIEPMFSR